MEETVGLWWHRAVMRWADREHAAAAVTLESMRRPIEMLFRAGGGAHGVRLAEAGARRVGGARGLVQRLAGSGRRAELASLDAEALSLPARVAAFESAVLNRRLYLWLAALASVHRDQGRWIADNLAATRQVLQVFPGLAPAWAALSQAHLAARPSNNDPRERVLRAALADGLLPDFELQAHEVAPVPLWLLPAPARQAAEGAARREPSDAAPAGRRSAVHRRLQAERAAGKSDRPPLVLPFRAEALLGWSELVRVDRAEDDGDDDAARAAEDLDHLSIAPDGQTSASRVRFDLDLPSAAADDLPLGPGEPMPEWDWRQSRLRPAHCAVQTFVARPGEPYRPPPALRATARRVRRQFEALRAAPRWLHAQPQGDEIDLDAWVRHATEGHGVRLDASRSGAVQAGLQAGVREVREREMPVRAQDAAPAVYRQRARGDRSLATLLLADLSLSTEAHVDDTARVIDVVRDALFVFGEALTATGDPFQMLGFSSVRRQHVRLQHLKGFDEPWNDRVRSRLAALKPGYYTRMGAALRAATRRLAERPERQRLLLLLTDGKPNDLDVYEGRYGLEDTRMAVHEARGAGLLPFAVTIDEEAADYLPQLFGSGGFALVRRPRDLVGRLAQVYARLTRHARSG